MMNRHPKPTYEPQDGVEHLERYRKGGYHPIAIDDEIHNGRYRIVHKLGYGSYSTVWLARDQQQNRFVSIKILIAGAPQSLECQVLRYLDLQPRGRLFSSIFGFKRMQHPGRQFLLTLLDEFELTGPNGNHLCIVTKVAGPSVSAVKCYSKGGHLPLDISRKIAMQCAKGLACLHACGIVHGDLHIGNVLFCIPDIDSWTLEQVYLYFGEPRKYAITRTDGKPPGPSAPQYVIRPPDPRKLQQFFLTNANTCTIQIVDFGEAFLSGGQSITKKLNTAAGVAAPEILFGEPVGPAVDIWALGCTLYEIFGNHQLFESFFNSLDEILVEIIGTFGKLPEQWWRKWEGRTKYFEEDGSFKVGIVNDIEGFNLKERVETIVRGDEAVDNMPKMEPEEMTAFEKTLRGMLRYGPEERIGAEEVLWLLPPMWGGH